MLHVSHLTKSFQSDSGTVTALKDTSFSVQTGEFTSIVGKSGSGKSTLLGLLGALDSPTSGTVTLDGLDVTKLTKKQQTVYRGQKIGFVFQQYNLIPNLSSRENVMLALEFGGVKAADRQSRADALLYAVGLEQEQFDRTPGKLSGGQQQRVAIARALANKPSLILADEPTGNLDSQTGKKIFELLHSLSRSQNTTIVVVTHDLEIAGKTDRIFEISDGKLREKA